MSIDMDVLLQESGQEVRNEEYPESIKAEHRSLYAYPRR